MVNVVPVNRCETCPTLVEEPDDVSVTPTLGFGLKLINDALGLCVGITNLVMGMSII